MENRAVRQHCVYPRFLALPAPPKTPQRILLYLSGYFRREHFKQILSPSLQVILQFTHPYGNAQVGHIVHSGGCEFGFEFIFMVFHILAGL